MSRKKPKSHIRKWTKNVVKKIIKTPFSITANTEKSAVSKANPFDQNINKNDVSDTGTESMRLAYTSVKKGKNAIKTVKRSVKTTQRTIKTAGNVVKSTGTVIYRTTAFTVKSTILVSKFVGNVVVHVVASLMNPIVIIFLGLIIVFLICFSSILMIIASDDTNKSARLNAVGLGNISSQYQIGLEYLNTALENHQNNFNSLIDSMYYNYDDLTNSSLVYMERTNSDDEKAVYEKSFSIDDRKNALKSEWNISLTEREFLAIAYVYLENEKNNTNHSEHGIYQVSYNQEVFDTIVAKCAVYSDNVYSGQKCPDENCASHVEMQHNPAYDEAVEATNHFLNAYNEWTGIADLITYHDTIKDGASQRAYWDSNVQWRIDNWKSVYFDSCYYSNGGWDYADDLYSWYSASFDYMITVPEETEAVAYICEYKHDLHSVGLIFFDKETVMNALEFDNISKQWVELTERGFENNPNIS
ncbi:MAG: hypothetical protein K2N27_05300 [Ruminococcus sp.]|nr:hypothetical protein [Ruminococcus sp.]